MKRSDVDALLARAASKSIAVIGDICLDEYLVGRAERLSREGPVPVLGFTRRFCLPGGAANPARNIAALGARALQVGVVGQDDEAAELRFLLDEAGIDALGVVTDSGRATTRKTRVVAEGLSAPQQVARIDRQARHSVSGDVEQRLIAAVESAAGRCDALLLSDYKSGVATEAVRAAALASATRHQIWLTVDSQGDVERFQGFHLVRVARRDAERSLGRRLDSETTLETATKELREQLGARVMVVSRGAQGMSVAANDGYEVVRPANVSEVFDVAGAGDTVIALVTLMLAAGANLSEAIDVANRGAGIVVRRLGVAAPTREELLNEFAG